ncbi:hypothetical protein [Deefgea sp. CFH1-16]|uniref:hypothetical protein n=1 Tax=Deefgea sp. CFH1-16 TaxID=2675457 RepID=UPI0015F63F1E|nr:hypothetical protein [Deefgea sp. CFH1-16]MBM5575806.1 hypothetical protein [Deefgea sp. CFH1-16]
MSNPVSHTCPTCGHTWRHGHSGDHNCTTRLVQQRGELLAALEAIAEWTERYTKPDHPISTVARKAIANVGAL